MLTFLQNRRNYISMVPILVIFERKYFRKNIWYKKEHFPITKSYKRERQNSIMSLKYSSSKPQLGSQRESPGTGIITETTNHTGES